MNKNRIRTTVVTASAAVAIGLMGAPLAVADDATAATTTTIGQQAKLVTGDVVQGWTVAALKPSTDAIPYAPRGTLWEATGTDEAVQGTVQPVVSNLNARAGDGENYRALFGVATAQGVNPAALAQGEKTSGKVYFDVTGANPDTVVYNSGGADLLVWKPAPPVAPAATGSGTQWAPPSSGNAQSAPAATAPAPAATGSQGTPLPEGTAATPAPAPAATGSQGTPLPEGTPTAPAPAAADQVAPAPAADSEGTPIPEAVPTPPVGIPHGSAGTPAS